MRPSTDHRRLQSYAVLPYLQDESAHRIRQVPGVEYGRCTLLNQDSKKCATKISIRFLYDELEFLLFLRRIRECYIKTERRS